MVTPFNAFDLTNYFCPRPIVEKREPLIGCPVHLFNVLAREAIPFRFKDLGMSFPFSKYPVEIVSQIGLVIVVEDHEPSTCSCRTSESSNQGQICDLPNECGNQLTIK